MAKQKTNLRTMNAKAELYGGRVTPTKVIRMMFGFEVGIAAFALLLYGLTSFGWLALWLLIGAVLVYKGILPYRIDNSYRQHGEAERSQFMRLVTQSMSTKGSSIVQAMYRAAKSAKGEFHDDLIELLVTIKETRNFDKCHAAFQKIQLKYKDDLYFSSFMDQCETTYFESIYHIDSFRSFLNTHDIMMGQEKYFAQQKASKQSSLFMILAVCWIVIAVTFLSQGYATYTKVWLSPIGVIASTVSLILIALILRHFYKLYFDDNVIEM